MRATRQYLACVEQDARQPRLATEADVPTYTKHGDGCFADKVDPDLMCLTSFGDDSTEPPTFLPCRDDAMVDRDTVAPKPCLSPVEMRTSTAAGSLLHAGTALTAIMTIFSRPLSS